jgi:hypothetical protein
LEEEARLKLIDDARKQLNGMGPQLGIEFIEDPKGVKLTKVVAGKSAARAGLCRGDVIMSVNGYDAINKVEFKRMVKSCVPGDQLIFKVYTHNFTLRTIVVKLGAIETDMATLEEVRRLATGKVKKQEVLAAKLQLSAQNEGTSPRASPLHDSPSALSTPPQQHEPENQPFSGSGLQQSASTVLSINIDGHPPQSQSQPPTPHSISSSSNPQLLPLSSQSSNP